MPNSFPPSNPNSSQNSATTPDYSPNPDSTNTPDSANSPDSTNNASSNTGNSDNKIFLLHTLVYLINNPWLAGFSKNYPRLGNLLAILIPVSSFFLGTGTTTVPTFWVKPVDEYAIDINAICDMSDIKPDGYKNISGVAESANDPKVWPIFQWECIYESTTTGSDGHLRSSIKKKGLNLTEDYCKKQYGEEFAAAYKHFDEPDSWYCTRDRKIAPISARGATVGKAPD